MSDPEQEKKFRMAYNLAANRTLESLMERFDELTESIRSNDYDVTYSDGVLTVKLGSIANVKGEMVNGGTYVINKQTPNLQIWLSSPLSGPKRFDFVDNVWIYKHTSEILHDLLQLEFNNYLDPQVTRFKECEFGARRK